MALVKGSSVARNTFSKASAEWSTSDAAVGERQQPIAPGQLKYSVALALQQHGQQSALRNGRG
jgi:hypothetical protein